VLVCRVGARLLLRQRKRPQRLAPASGLSQRSRCSSVPNRANTSAASELLTVAITATVALARARAATASA